MFRNKKGCRFWSCFPAGFTVLWVFSKVDVGNLQKTSTAQKDIVYLDTHDLYVDIYRTHLSIWLLRPANSSLCLLVSGSCHQMLAGVIQRLNWTQVMVMLTSWFNCWLRAQSSLSMRQECLIFWWFLGPEKLKIIFIHEQISLSWPVILENCKSDSGGATPNLLSLASDVDWHPYFSETSELCLCDHRGEFFNF